MTPNKLRWIAVGLLGLSLIIVAIVFQIADGKAQSADDQGKHTDVGDAAERLELAGTIMRGGDLDQMENEAAPLLRKIAFAINDQPEQALQAWLLLAEIHERLRDEFLSLTGQKIDALRGSAGEALIKQGKKDLGVDMLIREAWLLRTPAQLYLALLYTYPVEGFQRHDKRILKFYEESSAEGVPRSQLFMGKILLNGWGVPRDVDRAIILLRESGLGDAFMELAAYYFGEGNMVATENYLEQAAAEGIPKAHYNLGVLAQQRGDYSKAVSRFEKTLEIDSEYSEARLELARMYVEGWGVERNEELGFEMMKRVADTASGGVAAVAQMNVGNFYLEGIGTDRDLVLARQYYQKALDGGYLDAEEALNQLDSAISAPVFASDKTGPSFDCSMASTTVEHSICGSEELSALDRQMAAAYKAAESSAPSGSIREALLLVNQRLWNKGRASKCTENDQTQKTDCLARLYRRRILELTAQAEDIAESEVSSTQDAQPDDPAREYLDGHRTTFSTKDHPKAKGVHFTIAYPNTWVAAEGNRPNIVQKFVSEGGHGLESMMIITKDVPLPPRIILTEQDQKDLFSPSELPGMLPPGATIVDAQSTQIEAAPAGILEFTMRADRAGTAAFVRAWTLNFLSSNTLVQVQFSVGGLAGSEEAVSRRMADFKPLFKLMANSIVFPDKWTAVSEVPTGSVSRAPTPSSLPDDDLPLLTLTLAISFIVTWGIGLTPPLLIRFAILRRPIGRWWAIGTVSVLWMANLVIVVALGSTSKTHTALFLVALVSYFVLRKAAKNRPKEASS